VSRVINYKIEGQNKDRVDISQEHSFNFFNPKAGVSYNLSSLNKVYLTIGATNKEPNRDDFVNGIVNGITPKNEELRNIELGWKRRLEEFGVEVNGYYMGYKNQLVLTGEVNNVGEYMRVNTPDSYRAGIEASATYNYSTKIGISANIALSKNKINSFTETIYSYDAEYNSLGVVLRNHKNTDISFSPNIVAAARIRYKIYQNLFTSIESKYVGQQFLDNTSNNDRRIKPFFVNDLFFDYNLRLKEYIPMLTIVFKINNVFNMMYEPNGYTYTLIESGSENNYNYYYPQLGRNYMFSLNFNF
jgi:iron complex outermembrane receptor protein